MTFILVFRPHQRAAWATGYSNEAELVRCWIRGEFVRSCFAPGPAGDDESYEAAIEQIGHVLHNLTRLDSPEQVARYCGERDYSGRYNKARAAVMLEAYSLGWFNDVD
jgi:hypothetical protein